MKQIPPRLAITLIAFGGVAFAHRDEHLTEKLGAALWVTEMAIVQ